MCQLPSKLSKTAEAIHFILESEIMCTVNLLGAEKATTQIYL